jgi:hypothetical protein
MYRSEGSDTVRCGSLASSGRPVAVRSGASTQLLLPSPKWAGAIASL